MTERRSVSLAALALVLLFHVGCSDGSGPSPGREWSPAGTMITPRAYASITVLQSGKVLVAGGQPDYGGVWASAAVDLYDPATNRWTSTTHLGAARHHPCTALLPSGLVLIAGGGNPTTPSLATAELYDPDTDTLTPTSAPMSAGRAGATCSPLGSGKVLVVGGVENSSGVPVAAAELYDPETDTFAPTGSMATARYWHTATVLASGKVLVVGGCVGGDPCTTGTDSAELYDPAAGTWASAGRLAYPVMSHTATRLLSGKVLVAAGCRNYDGVGGCRSDGVHERRASLYDPAAAAAEAWSVTGALANGHSDHVALLLGSGEVVVVGGGYWTGIGPRTERYDPVAGTWREGPRAIYMHGNGAEAAQLLDGTWLVVGGVTPPDAYLGAAERFTE